MRERRRQQRWRMLVALFFSAWVGGVVSVVALILVQGVDKAGKWAEVLGALTAFAALCITLGERTFKVLSRARQADDDIPAEELDAAGNSLAAAVQKQWREEARTRRLQDPWPLPVRWTAADPALADHIDAVFTAAPGSPPESHPSPDSLSSPDSLGGHLSDAVAAFERLPHKRLVVLGRPGAGKSVFALTLLLDLLEKRAPSGLVPVLFPLVSWDPSALRLRDWMGQYLDETYHKGRTAGSSLYQGLVRAGRLLPILDGLDEIPAHLRPAGISQINHSLDRGQQLVLTCREEEFRNTVELSDVVTLAAVVRLLPLDSATVTDYLAKTTPARRASAWAPVSGHLESHPEAALAQVLSTPLMVWLARVIYGDNPRDPAELLGANFSSPSSIADHLLNELIPAVYPDVPPNRDDPPARWQATDVVEWLTFLATDLGRASRGDLAWWQLENAIPKIILEAVGGILGGLAAAIAFGPVVGLTFAVAVTLAGAAARSRSLTLEAWLTGRVDKWLLSQASRPVGRVAAAAVGSRDKVPVGRRLGLAAGRLLALLAGLTTGLSVLPSGGLWRGIADGLAAALAVGLAAGFFTISPRTTPSEVHFENRASLRAFLRHMMIGLLTGIGAGVTVGVLVNSSFGIVVGLAIGAAIGLIDGLNVWLDVSTDVTRALSPRSTRLADRLAAIARSVTVCLTVAIPSGIAFGFAYGLRSGVAHGLAFGLVFGLGDRYTGLGATLWGRYLVAKTWLALRHRVPWRLMAFLDDAHQHGVLRQAGPVYQFRHARLQEHLVARAQATAPELSSALAT
jgi:hypothetical protein